MEDTGMTSLTEKISEAMQKLGYPCELRLGLLAANAGWSVRHSQIYSDPARSKAREIDLLLSYAPLEALEHPNHDPDASHPHIRVTYAVEVKSRRNKPWVALTSPVADQQLESTSWFALTPYGAGFHVIMAAVDELQKYGKLASEFPTFEQGQRVGHGITQVFAGDREKVTGPYVAMRSALNACVALTATNTRSVADPSALGPVIDVVLPLVITGDDLFDCYIAHSGQLVVSQIASCRVVAPNPTRPEESLIVTIVQEAAAGPFLVQAAKDAGRLIALAYPEWHHIMDFFGKGRREE